MSRILTALGIVAGGALVAAGLGFAVSAPASAAVPHAFPAHVSAPYVDTGLSNVTLTSVAQSTGTKFFTLAFVDGAGCRWSMFNTASWQSQIANLRAAG